VRHSGFRSVRPQVPIVAAFVAFDAVAIVPDHRRTHRRRDVQGSTCSKRYAMDNAIRRGDGLSPARRSDGVEA